MDAFLGIDDGTGSARAGVFDREGHLLGTATQSPQLRKRIRAISFRWR